MVKSKKVIHFYPTYGRCAGLGIEISGSDPFRPVSFDEIGKRYNAAARHIA
jgi:hypothetical protein